MATIAVGDVHGSLSPLLDLLGQLRSEAAEGDTVVFLGDYIDRGASTRQCIDAILEFRAEAKATVICLCGNHEDWLLKTLRDHTHHGWLLGMDALDTIRSYSVEVAEELRDAAWNARGALHTGETALPYDLFFDIIPHTHMRFFEELVPHYQGEDCVCVHGGLDCRVEQFRDQSRLSIMWGGNGFPERYRGPETVIYGHKNNADLDGHGWPNPRVVGRTIGIDTISHGVLTAIRMPDRQVFQSARYDPFCLAV